MAFKMKYANGNGFPFKSSPMNRAIWPPDEEKLKVTKETKDEKTIVNPTLHESAPRVQMERPGKGIKITGEDVTKEMTELGKVAGKGATTAATMGVGKVLPKVLEKKKKKE